MTEDRYNLLYTLAQLQGRARFVVEITLVIGLALMIAQSGWLVIAPAERVAVQTQRPLPSPLYGADTSIRGDRTSLVKTNPFVSEAPRVVIEAPETQLNLRLLGARMSTGPDGGSAQITTPDNQTARYEPGQEILDGVVLERILADRVIIRRGGEAEVLMRVGRTSGLSVIGNVGQTVDETDPEIGQVQPLPESDGRMSDPQNLLSTVRLMPDRRDGRVRGYKMTLIGSEETLTRAGLRRDDILLDVNGIPVKDIDFSEILESMKSDEMAILGIERNGAEQTVRIRFNQ